MTSEEEKRLLLLAAIVRVGGTGTKKRILDEIANAGLMHFSAYDLETRRTRNELNWRNDLAYIRDHLVREGHVGDEWNSWRITERGRGHLASLAATAAKARSLQHIQQQAMAGLLALAQGLTLSDDAAVAGESTSLEGAVSKRWTTTYERDEKLRAIAIKLHGLRCAACSFEFEARYGAIGSGFIEVHHTKPVSSLGGATQVDPATDLVVLCSNCHSIVHRRKGEPLSLDELRKTLRE